VTACQVCIVGTVAPDRVEQWLKSGERWVLFRNVPANVCDSCGEATFDSVTADHLLQLAQSPNTVRPSGALEAAVYDLDEVVIRDERARERTPPASTGEAGLSPPRLSSVGG
jgi:YgiT-type zinc finger domain-containing protein